MSQRTDKPVPKIAIFVDYKDPKVRRYCYWERYFTDHHLAYELVSIPDLVRESEGFIAAVLAGQERDGEGRRQPRLDNRDLIILNWDCANGDFAFGADKTLSYFESRGKEEIIRWASRGARVVIEVQCQAGFPTQLSYDAVLGEGAVKLSPFAARSSLDDTEETLVRNRFRRHPVCQDLKRSPPDLINTKYRKFEHVVFPFFTDDSSFARNPERLSWGNFVSWHRDWHPLIFRPRRHARWSFKGIWERLRSPSGRCVALAKPVGDKGGEIVVTTMRIANSQNYDLLGALCSHGSPEKQRTINYYRQAWWGSLIGRSISITSIWLLGLAIGLPILSLLAFGANDGFQALIEPIKRLKTFTGDAAFDQFLHQKLDKVNIADVTAVAVVLTLLRLSTSAWKLRRFW